jgi:hypothetical protein
VNGTGAGTRAQEAGHRHADWLNNTPCQFIGMSALPAASIATRTELASRRAGRRRGEAVGLEVVRHRQRREVWKRRVRRSDAGAVGAEEVVDARRETATSPHVAAGAASPHGSGSVSAVTAIVAGPVSVLPSPAARTPYPSSGSGSSGGACRRRRRAVASPASGSDNS